MANTQGFESAGNDKSLLLNKDKNVQECDATKAKCLFKCLAHPQDPSEKIILLKQKFLFYLQLFLCNQLPALHKHKRRMVAFVL